PGGRESPEAALRSQARRFERKVRRLHKRILQLGHLRPDPERCGRRGTPEKDAPDERTGEQCSRADNRIRGGGSESFLLLGALLEGEPEALSRCFGCRDTREERVQRRLRLDRATR